MNLVRLGPVALAALSSLLFGAGASTLGTRQADGAPVLKATAILQTNCIKCHDSDKKTAGIDLTTRSNAVACGALDDRNPMQSQVVLQVTAGHMPPTGKLPDETIAILHQWVLKGAPYPTSKLVSINPAMLPLWSFQPVRAQPVPRTRFDKLARNPIDNFVFDKLAANRLSPSSRADKLTLLRRVTIDLTGLPPTPREISDFLRDRSPYAYEKVVDRLLASPAYGERWARHWLDVVRYGESDGYERNLLRPNAWPYRDYVIRAFNQDLPFTRFITEQLAGDVVGNGDPNVEAATGFLVAGIHDTVANATEEGTRQQRISDLEDITSTTANAFLAVTVGCARCHDHKFDPVPQRDFYRLAAVFAGVRFGDRPIISGTALSKEKAEKAVLASQAFKAINALNELDDEARQSLERGDERTGRWAGHAGRQTNGSTHLDASVASRPAVNARRNVDIFPAASARFVRFTALATRDGAEPCLDELQVYGPEGHGDLALASNGAVASASGLLPGFDIHKIEHLNDGRFGNDFSWISDRRGAGWAQIMLAAPRKIDRVIWSRDGGEIPRFDDRLATQYRIEVSLDGSSWRTVSTETGRAGQKGRDYVHPDKLIKAMTREGRARRAELQETLQHLRKRTETLDALNTAYAGQFSKPDPTFVLRRGDVMQRAEQVAPGALSQVSELPSDLCSKTDASDSDRRLALAHWIGSERNPLTARVIVNRIWQYHFGRGIVGTPSDFGRNGEKPTHPELLDWLAKDFMSHGWRMKRLQKMIAMSYTYCQSEGFGSSDLGFGGPSSETHYSGPKNRHQWSLAPYSAPNIQGQRLDASNRFLWHMPLRRMEAEALRDSILATSGKLDRSMGGPGFRLFKYSELNVANYDPLDTYGPDTWRRAIYRTTARSIRDDLLENFDCPECAQREPKRATTTTAIQALTLLNGKFLVQQAGFFAERVRREAGLNPRSQVDRAFELAFGRLPNASERRAAVRLSADQGLPTLCRALMNANEFLYY